MSDEKARTKWGYFKGPWIWHGNASWPSVTLATDMFGKMYVMGFRRWGMRGAQPEFQIPGHGMLPAADFLKFQVGNQSLRGLTAAKADKSVYRFDIRDIDHPDAQLIKAAPAMHLALELIALGKARIEIVGQGTSREFCFGGMRYSFKEGESWSNLFNLIGWDHLYAALEPEPKFA